MTQDAAAAPHPARFTSASMIAAQMCTRCGSLVGGEGRQAHLDFHRELETGQAAVNQEVPASSKKGKKK